MAEPELQASQCGFNRAAPQTKFSINIGNMKIMPTLFSSTKKSVLSGPAKTFGALQDGVAGHMLQARKILATPMCRYRLSVGEQFLCVDAEGL